MHKNNIAFKQIRRRVVCQANPNCQNTPINLQSPLIFLKADHKIPLISQQNSSINQPYNKYSTQPLLRKCKTQNNTYQDCNKFSMLLQSKRYTNYNDDKIKVIPHVNHLSSTKHPTSHQKIQINPDKLSVKCSPNRQPIAHKPKQLKNKQYLPHKQISTELSSLCKLKNKVVNPLLNPITNPHPLPQKPQPSSHHQQPPTIISYSSILSEHDLVNMSKNNQTIKFDMSPCL